MSSYQDFIENILKNTASDSDVQEAIDNLIVFDNDNNLSSGKIKDLFESMGLTEEVPNTDGTVKGKNSLDSIETSLIGIQASITDLTTRIGALENAIPPVITLLGDASITITQGSTYEDAGATASDNLDSNLTSSIEVGGLDTLDTNVAGDYIITYNVKDSSGNAATEVTRTVSVVPDLTVPVITLLGDASIIIHPGSTYEDAGATATDNFDGDLTSSIVVGGLPDTNVPGEYTITYNLTDAAGNAATEVTRTVTVVDLTVPVITLLGASSITIVQGSTYEDAGATATDNVDGDLTSSIVVGGLPDTNVPGEYTITYNLTDAAGNAATEVTRIVMVVEPIVGSPASLFTWDNSGQIELVQLQEEYTQSFKSNNENKTLAFGASSFTVPMNKLDIHNYDTSTLLSLASFHDITINGSDFKLRIDRVRTNTSALANNVIVADTGNTFSQNTKISQSYADIYFGGNWVNNFYRVVGTAYDADTIRSRIFLSTVPQDNNNYHEVDYLLSHTSDSAQDIILTFQVKNNGDIGNVKHNAFTFDSNYYSFDTDGNFVLNNMTFQEARQYDYGNWNTLQGSSADISTYGVSISLPEQWSVGNGKVVDSFIEFNPDLNGIKTFNSIDLSHHLSQQGLKVKENVALQGYIQNKVDISLYDSTGITPIENLDFTFNQIDLNNSYQLTDVVQSFLPSSGFKVDTYATNVTLDPNITYKIDNIDVTNDEITIDNVTEITAHPFLTSV